MVCVSGFVNSTAVHSVEGQGWGLNCSLGLCRSHGQGGLGLSGCALPGFSGTSQAGGGEGLGAGASRPAQAQDMQGWLMGPQE